MRKTNWLLGGAVLAAAFTLAGCADQSGMEQLNQNEFTLRGMIASDRQQIDSLKAQVARQNDQIEELQHNTTPAAGQAPAANDRIASLEAEVKALQAGMAATPGAVPPPGAPAGQRRSRHRSRIDRTTGWRGLAAGHACGDSADLARRTRSGNCRRRELRMSRASRFIAKASTR